jgi:hypothetical protein
MLRELDRELDCRQRTIAEISWRENSSNREHGRVSFLLSSRRVGLEMPRPSEPAL